MSVSVLFVCLGNICRSPTAEAVFTKLIEDYRHNENSSLELSIDSAGTGGWHVGKAPDSRAQAAGKKRGYDLSVLRGRQVSQGDFSKFDYILAMDQANLSDLKRMSDHANFKGHLGLFLEFGHSNEREVPDPYYGGESGFEYVLDLIEDASRGLITHIVERSK